jgi:phage-related protein
VEPRLLKPLAFVGSAHADLRAFPAQARRRAGYQLFRIQEGREAADAKPMPSVGQGVYEIRIATEGQAYRVFYVAKFEEAVYILHAFEKKSRKTSKQDIEIGRTRYRTILAQRRT